MSGGEASPAERLAGLSIVERRAVGKAVASGLIEGWRPAPRRVPCDHQHHTERGGRALHGTRSRPRINPSESCGITGSSMRCSFLRPARPISPRSASRSAGRLPVPETRHSMGQRPGGGDGSALPGH